jgi:hypothetical protein
MRVSLGTTVETSALVGQFKINGRNRHEADAADQAQSNATHAGAQQCAASAR